MRRVALALVTVSLIAPGVALGNEERPTLAELESEVMCPICGTTLELSNSPAADQIRREIARAIEEGKTKSEIKAELVSQFGEGILAAPPKEGFNLLAWVLPLAGIGVGALVVGALAWRWSRVRTPASAPAAVPLDADLERRLDEELARFDG